MHVTTYSVTVVVVSHASMQSSQSWCVCVQLDWSEQMQPGAKHIGRLFLLRRSQVVLLVCSEKPRPAEPSSPNILLRWPAVLASVSWRPGHCSLSLSISLSSLSFSSSLTPSLFALCLPSCLSSLFPPSPCAMCKEGVLDDLEALAALGARNFPYSTDWLGLSTSLNEDDYAVIEAAEAKRFRYQHFTETASSQYPRALLVAKVAAGPEEGKVSLRIDHFKALWGTEWCRDCRFARGLGPKGVSPCVEWEQEVNLCFIQEVLPEHCRSKWNGHSISVLLVHSAKPANTMHWAISSRTELAIYLPQAKVSWFWNDHKMQDMRQNAKSLPQSARCPGLCQWGIGVLNTG